MFTLPNQILRTSLLMAVISMSFSSCAVMQDKLASNSKPFPNNKLISFSQRPSL